MQRSILRAPSVSRAKCSPAQDLENTTEPLDKRSTPQREMRYEVVEDGVKYSLISPQLCMSTTRRDRLHLLFRVSLEVLGPLRRGVDRLALFDGLEHL